MNSLRRTYKYRIYPTKTQAVALREQLAFCCNLYNAALEQRKDAWKLGRRRVTLYDQTSDLTDLRRSSSYPVQMACKVQRDPLQRLDRAFQDFFRRCRQGEKPGYPRFRSLVRYDSLTWPYDSGAGIRDRHLRLAGIGHVRVNWHRALPNGAVVKTVTVKRVAERWYTCLSLEMPLPKLWPSVIEPVGVDLGITSFAALSNGELIPGPRAYRKAQRQLRVAQRRVSRRKRGSNRRKKAILVLARKHEYLKNTRRDHAFKTAVELVSRFGVIAIEDLNVRGLARGWLSKDVHDQGWSQFTSILSDKAEEAGRKVVVVDARYTSQECPECGAIVKKGLGERVHDCTCGYTANRDVAAARVVLQRGLGRSLQAITVGEEVRAVA